MAKGFPVRPHAGHDFVGDQQNFIFAADFRDARDVAVAGHSGSQRGADDRLKNKCGGGMAGWAVEKFFKIVGAREAVSLISQIRGAVIRETRSDVAPFGEQRLIGSAARDVAADGHRAKRAAVVTLAARNHAVTLRLVGFQMELARQLDGGFGGFRAAGGEVNTAAILEIWRRKLQKTGGKFFRGRGMELRSMRECELRGLLGHGAADFGDAVADVDDRGLACGIQKTAAIGRNNPAAFAAHGDGIILAEISRENAGVIRHGGSGRDCSRVKDWDDAENERVR